MTYDYVKLFSGVFFAMSGAIIWSAIDRNRKNYAKLLRLLVHIWHIFWHLLCFYIAFIK